MWKKPVQSYRVREFDQKHYVVETYTMELEDEWLALTTHPLFQDRFMQNVWKVENNTGERPYTQYYIQYASRVDLKTEFLQELQERYHNLKRSVVMQGTVLGERCKEWEAFLAQDANNEISEEDLNSYLAWLYFPKSWGTNMNLEELPALMEQAWNFTKIYNERLKDELFQKENIQEEMDNILKASGLSDLKIVRTECVNVGQASLAFGYTEKNERKAVFDLGIRSVNSKPRRHQVETRLGKIDGNGVVILSHFDQDHICGFRYLSDQAKQRVWIMPTPRQFPSSTERNLLAFLEGAICVHLPDIDYDQTPFRKQEHTCTVGNIEIYQGNAKKKDKNQSTSEKARCLICLVKGKKSMLFPGDCLYQEFPCKFSVEYMAVPHHSCHYQDNIKNVSLDTLQQVVVHAGPHRGYKHPDLNHVEKLTAGGRATPIYLMNHGTFAFLNDQEVQNYPEWNISDSYEFDLTKDK